MAAKGGDGRAGKKEAGSKGLRPWKSLQGGSEAQLAGLARELAAELKPGDRVLLEGPMGAGKSTFARAALMALGIDRPPEGSPSFAIAHEYPGVIHVDLYRLEHESEIEEAGLEEAFWSRDPAPIALVEWASKFPAFEAALLRRPNPGARAYSVAIAFADGAAMARDVVVRRS